MTKLGITFIILIIVGVLVEAALLFKIVAIPPDISQLISGQSKPNAVSLEKIAPAEGSISNISIAASGMQPSTIRVRLGDKIIWTNNTSSPVTIESEHPFLHLGEAQPTQTLRVIMRQIGTFTYYDSQAPQKKGTIIVE